MQKTLYQKDSNGRIKIWSISVVTYNNNSDIIIRSGILNGNHVVNTTTIDKGKNIGRSNETTHFEQACKQAESKIASKIKKGYVEDISKAKSSDVLGSGIPAPMLAQKYDPTGKQKGSKTLQKLGIEGHKIAVQPKIDGNRCLIVVDKQDAKMYTRKGDLMPVQLNHILEHVHKVFLELFAQDYNKVILDGELFSDEFTFNELNGMLKREKNAHEKTEELLKVKYHIYDQMEECGYEDRYDNIRCFENDDIVLIPNYYIEANEEEIDKFLKMFLSDGHEGLMIRQLREPYENKRSWQLCKMKNFEDSEFKLVDFVEDVRGGFVGSFVMEDENGNRFNAGASGQSVSDRTKIWQNPSAFLGKMATVEYFGVSEYGIPRFPKFKGIR